MALAKNFTGPTMGRMPPLIEPPVPGLDLPMRAAAMPIQYQPSRRLVLLGRMSPTFPPAYKARIADPATGRIFPR